MDGVEAKQSTGGSDAGSRQTGETHPERALRAIFPAICAKYLGKERLIIPIFLSSTPFVIRSDRSDVFGPEKQH